MTGSLSQKEGLQAPKKELPFPWAILSSWRNRSEHHGEDIGARVNNAVKLAGYFERRDGHMSVDDDDRYHYAITGMLKLEDKMTVHRPER